MGDSLPAAGSPDLAAAYLIAGDGSPRRIGVAQGHRGRVSSLGPELILDPALPRLRGVVKREGVVKTGAGSTLRSHELTAEVPLLLALASIEPDHFESADFRRAGDVHIHFFGERVFECSAHIDAAEDEQAEIEFEGLGRKLLNSIRSEEAAWRVAAVPL